MLTELDTQLPGNLESLRIKQENLDTHPQILMRLQWLQAEKNPILLVF